MGRRLAHMLVRFSTATLRMCGERYCQRSLFLMPTSLPTGVELRQLFVKMQSMLTKFIEI